MTAEEEIAISPELICLQSESDAPKQLASLDANLLERVSKTTMQAWPQVSRQNGETYRESRRERAHLSRLRVELAKHLPGSICIHLCNETRFKSWTCASMGVSRYYTQLWDSLRLTSGDDELAQKKKRLDEATSTPPE